MESFIGLFDPNGNGQFISFLTGNFPLGQFMAAEFALRIAKGQYFSNRKSRQSESSCIFFRRVYLSLYNVSLRSCCLFRCFQFKTIFTPFWWAGNSFMIL
jgi:hypothetical protein